MEFTEFLCAWNQLVNPDFVGKGAWFGSASHEALRVELMDNIEYGLVLPNEISCHFGFFLKELVNVIVRKSLKPPCLTNLG